MSAEGHFNLIGSKELTVSQEIAQSWKQDWGKNVTKLDHV